jgi:hypothetical protein
VSGPQPKLMTDDLDPWPSHAERWRRNLYDRLYVRASNGTPIGWYDLTTGDTHAVEPWLRMRLLTFMFRWLSGAEAKAIGDLPLPHDSYHPRSRVQTARHTIHT